MPEYVEWKQTKPSVPGEFYDSFVICLKPPWESEHWDSTEIWLGVSRHLSPCHLRNPHAKSCDSSDHGYITRVMDMARLPARFTRGHKNQIIVV